MAGFPLAPLPWIMEKGGVYAIDRRDIINAIFVLNFVFFIIIIIFLFRLITIVSLYGSRRGIDVIRKR